MNIQLPLTGLAAALCLLLTGCAPLERIDKTDTQILKNEKQYERHLNAINNVAVVRDLYSHWINHNPLNA
ncbi:PilN family type IVB pilus formation outer membrane protein, partial [Yersinia enterocolitica]